MDVVAGAGAKRQGARQESDTRVGNASNGRMGQFGRGGDGLTKPRFDSRTTEIRFVSVEGVGGGGRGSTEAICITAAQADT